MDVARPKLITKSSRALTSVTRKTSCSSGWIRLVVQTTFATITVASFILIVIMAVKNPQHAPALRPTVPLRCKIQGCSVICKEAPYFGNFEEDIMHSVMEADGSCNRVYLELQKPYFVNNTLPYNWLSRLRNDIHQISINGGNLMHFPSGAFMAQFMGSVKILVLQDLRIRTFESTSLVGLSSLRTFSILNCWIDGVEQYALRAVDDTLESLTISETGEWDPIAFTGSRGFEQLTIVDFSFNNFNQILNENSFVGLQVTKILYLNFCRITAIGAGTFDHLKSIEVLYLHNNMLSILPSGLFDTIVALDNPRPRINLQDNYWYCNCSDEGLRQLIRKKLLLVEVKCTFPEKFAGISFTKFEAICNNDTDALYDDNITDVLNVSTSNKVQLYADVDPLYVNGSYCGSAFRTDSLKLYSPQKNSKCSKSLKNKMLNLPRLAYRKEDIVVTSKSKLLQFSYFIKTDLFSVVQIKALMEEKNYGLIWYQSTCPYEIYCLDAIPYVLKLYQADPSAHYMFCPIFIKNGSIINDDCIDIYVERNAKHKGGIKALQVVAYVMIMLLCSCLGAVIVYGLIRRRPTLLKGSKRILFVKHKNVEALVLPPKIPLRNDLMDFKDKEVFTLTSGHNDKLKLPNMKRMKSVRSDKSGSPSYISAMQPTEEQLAEWRIKHHFNNDLTISSRKSEKSIWSQIDTAYYYSLDENDRTYESLK